MPEQEKREVSRRVKTPLDEISHDAALAVNLNPHDATVVDAGVTADGQLQLTIKGSEI